MDAWSKITHHKYCFLVPRSLDVSDVQSATMHDTQRKCSNIRNGTLVLTAADSATLGSFRVAPAGSTCSEPVPAVPIDAASERHPAFLNYIIVFRAVGGHWVLEGPTGGFRRLATD
jgi:hypothetical protein